MNVSFSLGNILSFVQCWVLGQGIAVSFNLCQIATVGYNVSGVSVCSPQPTFALVRDVSIFYIYFGGIINVPLLFASLFGTPLLLNCFWSIYHFCLESIHISVLFNSAFYIGVINADLLFVSVLAVFFSSVFFLYLFVYSCTCLLLLFLGGGDLIFCLLLFAVCFVFCFA